MSIRGAARRCVCVLCVRMSVGLGGCEKVLWLLQRRPCEALVFSVSVLDLLYVSGSLCHRDAGWNTSPHPPHPHQQPSSSCRSQAFRKEEELGECISNRNSSSTLGQPF